MCGSPDGQAIIVIRWGVRSLYVLLFLSCMVVMGRWHLPISIAFLGSVFALILPVLFSLTDKDLESLEEDEIRGDMNNEDISPVDAEVI